MGLTTCAAALGVSDSRIKPVCQKEFFHKRVPETGRGKQPAVSHAVRAYTRHYILPTRYIDRTLRVLPNTRAGRPDEGIDDSLANAARCDRLDKVRIVEGSVADVDLM